MKKEIEKLRGYVEERLKALGTNISMAAIGSDDAEKALGQTVEYEDLKAAAGSLNSKEFDLTVRGSDDFSATPYIWVTPRPPEISVFTKDNPPDPCFVIRNPQGTSSLRRDEGLYVFSKHGYAIGLAKSMGLGDFNVEPFSWSDIQQAYSNKGSVVVDYREGAETMNIIPLG